MTAVKFKKLDEISDLLHKIFVIDFSYVDGYQLSILAAKCQNDSHYMLVR